MSAAPSPKRGARPRIVWNDEAWQLLFSEDDPSGSRPDYLHARSFDMAGALGPDHDLRVPAEQIAFTARGPLGYATVTQGGSPRALRLWDLHWTATTTLDLSTASTFDGSRGIAWDGDHLYVTDVSSTFAVVRFNRLGTETGRIDLTADTARHAARAIHMERRRPARRPVVLEHRWAPTGGAPRGAGRGRERGHVKTPHASPAAWQCPRTSLPAAPQARRTIVGSIPSAGTGSSAG